jgi:hypothetical protein
MSIGRRRRLPGVRSTRSTATDPPCGSPDAYKNIQFFKHTGLTTPWRRNAAHSYESFVAKCTENDAATMKTVQHRTKEPSQCSSTALVILNAEGADVIWIVAHPTAEKSGCLGKLASTKFSQGRARIYLYRVSHHRREHCTTTRLVQHDRI